jgi:hypothetical protein
VPGPHCAALAPRITHNGNVAKVRRHYSSDAAIAAALKAAYDSTRKRYVDYGSQAQLLYHYCAEQTMREILKSGKLRATDVLQMDDPKEITYAHDVIQTVVSERGEDDLPVFQIKGVKDAETVRDIWSRWCTHIACLSSESDSPSQWKKYANEGSGMAIGFAGHPLAKELFKLGTPLIPLLPISYDRQQHEETIRDFLSKTRTIEIKRGKRPEMAKIYRYLESLAMTMKHLDWSEEHEWRILIIQIGESRFEKFLDKKERCFFALPIVSSLTVREIVIGPCCRCDENELRHFLSESKMPAVGIRRSSAHGS